MSSQTLDSSAIARLAAASVVELSHPMQRGMPNHESHPPYLFTPFLRYGDFELDDGYEGTNELIVMSGHSGTHLDSFAHVACHGMLFGDEDAVAAQRGGLIRHHGIDSVEPIVRRGVFLDVAAHHHVDTLPVEDGVDAAALAAVAEAGGVEIQAGDCVMVRTGQGRHWDDPERYLGHGVGSPGITVDAAQWLADREVFLVGADTSIVEQVVGVLTGLPVHLLLLSQRGVHLLENMELEAMHETRAVEFLFVCLPLLLKGASGSPVRPVALI